MSGQLLGTTNQIQAMAVVWITRFPATLSALGSLAIMYMILLARKEKLTKSNHRLMLALSTFDVFHSAAVAATTLASPRDTHFYGAMGNNGTCSAQGFLLILGLAVPMYNTSLSLFFLLTIRFRVSRTTFSAKIEPILHTVSILAPLALAIVSVSIGGITSESVVCYLSFEGYSSVTIDILWSVIAGILFICFIFNLCSMISISCYVVTRLNSVRRYSLSDTQQERIASEKRDVVVQSLFYTGAFLVTFFFPVFIMTFNQKSFFTEICSDIFYPLQGFWNFLLYTRPSAKQMKERNPDKYWIHIYWEVICHADVGNKPLMQKVRDRRDKNDIDVDEVDIFEDKPNSPPAFLSRNDLQMLQLYDSEEMEESKSEELNNL